MTAREFRVDEILTLLSGATWRVQDLHSGQEGRPGVGLVNPFNPNHGTSFYADVLAGLIAERPVPEALLSTMPPCSVCFKEVSMEDNEYFLCANCGCSWPVNGLDVEPGEWNDEEATQCTSLLQPFPTNPDPRLREKVYRCFLDAGHDDRHTNPVYVGCWLDDDPRAIPAEQSVEAKS